MPPMQGPEPSAAERIVAFKDAFWKFLRPHTIRGTILGSSAVAAKALLEHPEVRMHWFQAPCLIPSHRKC